MTHGSQGMFVLLGMHCSWVLDASISFGHLNNFLLVTCTEIMSHKLRIFRIKPNRILSGLRHHQARAEQNLTQLMLTSVRGFWAFRKYYFFFCRDGSIFVGFSQNTNNFAERMTSANPCSNSFEWSLLKWMTVGWGTDDVAPFPSIL